MTSIIAIVAIVLVLTVGTRAARSLLGGSRDERRSVDQYGRALRTLRTLPERAADDPGEPAGGELPWTGADGERLGEHAGDAHLAGSRLAGSRPAVPARRHGGAVASDAGHLGGARLVRPDPPAAERLGDRITFRADALPRPVTPPGAGSALDAARALAGRSRPGDPRLAGLESLVAVDAPWPVQEAARIIGLGDGRHERDAAVEANARLTGTTGLLLAVLFFLEGLTIPLIHRVVAWHILIGLVLVPPLLVKMGSTLWRFGHYYVRDPRYRKAGPPHPLLRVLGPVVLLSTVLLMGSGIALWLAGPGNATLFRVHQLSFVLWFVVVAVHVAAHLLRATRLAAADAHDASRAARGVPPRDRGRARRRRVLVVASLLAGLAIGAAADGAISSSPWNHLGTFRPAAGAAASRPGG